MNRPYFVSGWVLVSLGWFAGLLGWLGVQGTARVPVQLAYLASGGLSGLALVIIGAALLAVDDRRRIRDTVEELREQLDDMAEALAALEQRGRSRRMAG